MEFDAKVVGERLRELREIDGLTADDAAKKIGINVITLRKYESGENSKPEIKTLMKFAEYYGISMDYILGRVNLNGDYYVMDVHELLEKSYEKYLSFSSSVRPEICGKYDRSPLPQWPYNLFEEIYKEEFENLHFPFTDEQKEFVMAQIDTLTEREKKCVLLYFKEYKTLDQVGDEFGLTKARIRQIIMKGVRKLRSRAKLGELKQCNRSDILWRLQNSFGSISGVAPADTRI